MADYFSYFKVGPIKTQNPLFDPMAPPLNNPRYLPSIPAFSSDVPAPNLPSNIVLDATPPPYPAPPNAFRPGTNPDTGEFNDSNCIFPQVYANMELRCKELYTGQSIKFNCDSTDFYNKLGRARDVNTGFIAPIRVDLGGGALINNLRFFSTGSGATPGDKQYSFSQVIRRLKDIGLLERGVGWAPPIPAANPWNP